MTDIPEDVMKLAREAYDKPQDSSGASLVSLISKDSEEHVLRAIALAILADRAARADLATAGNDRERLAFAIQNLFARHLEVDADGDIINTGICSFAIADYVLNSTSAAIISTGDGGDEKAWEEYSRQNADIYAEAKKGFFAAIEIAEHGG